MDSALSIADSSLNAQRTALAVTSENIANSQTPGYVDESVQLAATPGDATGIGSGVTVTTVTQAQNALLTTNNLQAQGALQSLSSASQVLTGIENIFPLGQSSSSSTSTSTNTSLAGQLASFWSDWDAIAEDPSATAGPTQVLNDAQGLVTTLNEASTQLTELGQNTESEITDQVAQLNSLLSQAAQLNGQIVTTEGAAGNPDQLNDQMNQVVGQLASIAGVTVKMQPDGTALISSGGVALVQSTQAVTLAASTSGGTTSITTDNGAIPVGVSSGSLAGLLQGVNQYLPQYQASLNGVAENLASMVNTQLAAGYTLAGASGSSYPMFEGSTAGTISVNQALVSDPSLLAVAATNGAAGANDGSNAQAMAELSNSATGPDAAYQTMIQSIGSASASVSTQVSAQTSVANQAQAALSSATGVNQDTELTNLMSFQQTYEASAKLLSTIDQTMQSLIQAV